MITIHGPIDRITLHSLERRLDEAKARGADAVVLDIDTFGGDLQATIEILYLLRSKAPANTVAWIHPKAYSAGTIIALAMREIVVDSNGVFGDAAPIQGMPLTGLRQMAPAERAKIEAPLLSELVHEARRHGWDERLVQSFAAVDVSLWLIEHRSTGRQLFVDKDEYQEIFGEAPPLTRLKRLPPTPGRDPMSGLLPGADIDLDEPVPTSAERDIQIDEVQDLPSQRPDIESIDPAEWISLGQVVSEDELLVLKADEAEAYGLSSGKVDNETQLKSFFGANQIDRYDERWSEHLVRFLTWWPVRGVLIVIMLVGFFFEMASPGSGTFGAVALSALGILLLAPLMVGLAEWWTAIIVILGLLLVVLELFVIPGGWIHRHPRRPASFRRPGRHLPRTGSHRLDHPGGSPARHCHDCGGLFRSGRDHLAAVPPCAEPALQSKIRACRCRRRPGKSEFSSPPLPRTIRRKASKWAVLAQRRPICEHPVASASAIA